MQKNKTKQTENREMQLQEVKIMKQSEQLEINENINLFKVIFKSQELK